MAIFVASGRVLSVAGVLVFIAVAFHLFKELIARLRAWIDPDSLQLHTLAEIVLRHPDSCEYEPLGNPGRVPGSPCLLVCLCVSCFDPPAAVCLASQPRQDRLA
jgi:hypothetical protein